MGRFEDLIEQAKEGNTDALDELESEFGGSTLREKAEQADTFRSKYEQALPHMRKARLDELAAKLDDDLRDVGLGVDDFGDFDPDDLFHGLSNRLEVTQHSGIRDIRFIRNDHNWLCPSPEFLRQRPTVGLCPHGGINVVFERS